MCRTLPGAWTAAWRRRRPVWTALSSYTSLVRYDAYGEMSGRQSMSIALLDATQTGIVLSSIHHRDQARLYAKQIQAGRGELELSPEEAEAVALALRGSPGRQPAPR